MPAHASAIVTKIIEDGAGVTGPGPGPPGPAGLVTGLLSKVTAPVRARALPWRTAPVPSEIDAKARMFPENVEEVPSVAELPTCQKTLAAWAPLTRTTLLLVAVVSPLAIWKMN